MAVDWDFIVDMNPVRQAITPEFDVEKTILRIASIVKHLSNIVWMFGKACDCALYPAVSKIPLGNIVLTRRALRAPEFWI